MDNDRLCPQPRTLLCVLWYLCLITGPALIQSGIVSLNKGTELAADIVLGSAIIQTILAFYGAAVLLREEESVDVSINQVHSYIAKWTSIPASYVLAPLPLWFFTNIFCMTANIAVIPTYTLILTFVPVIGLFIGLLIGFLYHRRPDYVPV